MWQKPCREIGSLTTKGRSLLLNTQLLSNRRLPAKQALRRGGKLGQSEKFLERLDGRKVQHSSGQALLAQGPVFIRTRKPSWRRRRARPAGLNPPGKISDSAKPHGHSRLLRGGETQVVPPSWTTIPSLPTCARPEHTPHGRWGGCSRQVHPAADPPSLLPPDKGASGQHLSSPGSMRSPPHCYPAATSRTDQM